MSGFKFHFNPLFIIMPRKDRVNFSSASATPIVAKTEGEVLFLAQALDYYRAVQQSGKEAPFGQFLNRAEAAVDEKGRELLRVSLEQIVQTEIDEVEKKMSRVSVQSAKRNESISATALKPSAVPAVPSSQIVVTKNAVLAVRSITSMRSLDWKITQVAFVFLLFGQVRKAPSKKPKRT